MLHVRSFNAPTVVVETMSAGRTTREMRQIQEGARDRQTDDDDGDDNGSTTTTSTGSTSPGSVTRERRRIEGTQPEPDERDEPASTSPGRVDRERDVISGTREPDEVDEPRETERTRTSPGQVTREVQRQQDRTRFQQELEGRTPTQRDAVDRGELTAGQRQQLAEEEQRFAQAARVHESQVVPVEEDEGVRLALTAAGIAGQREQFADELGVRPGLIDVREREDDGFEFVPDDEALVELAGDDFDEFGPRDLETVEEDGETMVRPTEDAQERFLREQILDEHPDADDIEFRQEDGELVAEFEIQDRTVDERIRDAVVGAATSPRETAITIGTAPFRAQVRFFSGVATTIQDPRGAAESAASSTVDGLSTAGDVVVSGITDPIDTDGFGDSATGTVREVASRVDEGTPGEIQSDQVERLTGAVRDSRDEPSGLVTEPTGVVGTAVTDPIDTEGLRETPSGAVLEVGSRIDEGTPGQVQPERVQALRQRPEILLAGAGVVAPEPSTTLVGAGVLGGTAVAAGTTATQDDFTTEFDRAEIALPEDRRVGVTGAEIGVPEERRAGIRRREVGIPDDRRIAVQQAEVGVPEERRTAVRQPEVGIPEDPIDTGIGDGPLIRTSPIGIQRQRRQEQPFIEEEEDPFIITGEDLVDPEELRRREAEELREQVEQQAIFSETPAEEFDEEVEPFVTFGEPEVDVTDTAEREIGLEVEDVDVGVGVRPRPRQRGAVGVQQDQRVGTQAALDQVGMAQTTQTAMGQQMQTVTQTVPAQAAAQAFEFGFGQQVGTAARPPMQLGMPMLDATGTDRGGDLREDATAADLTDFIDPLTGDVLETDANDTGPGFDDLPGFPGLR